MKFTRFLTLLLCLVCADLPVFAQQNWRWLNTLPASVNWGKVAYGNGVYVIVGADATIASSPDAVAWTVRRMSTAGYALNSVAFGGGRFVAVGMGGAQSVGAALIMTSTDGVTWTANEDIANARIAQFHDVVYGNGVWVVTGAGNNQVLTSTDGLTWTARNATVNVTRVAFGGGKFIATNDVNRVVSSSDGVTWTSAFLTGDANTFNVGYSGIAYGAGKFVVVGRDANFNASVYTSADGAAWAVAPAISGGANGVQWVAFANNAFVMAGTAGIFSSPDGTTWTKRTGALPPTRASTTGSVSTENVSSVSAANNLFFTLGIYGGITSSTDGATWTRRDTGTAHDINGLLHDGTKFVGTGTGGTVVTSTDGVTWTASATNQTGWFGKVAYGAGRYVTAGYSGAYQSADLATWTGIGGSGGNQMFGVIYANNRFVASPSSIALGLRVSTDGVTWTNATIAGTTGHSVYGLAGGDGTYVITSGGFGATATPKIFSSADATTWTERTPASFTTPNSLAYGNGRYVLLTNTHSWTSTDGATWTANAFPSAAYVTNVKFVGDKFIAKNSGNAGAYHTFKSSADGVTWTEIENSSAPNVQFEAMVAKDGKVYGVGGGGAILVSDLAGGTGGSGGGGGSGGSSSTPQSQAVAAGGSATLSTAATGTIQWSRNGTDVSGATGGSLALSNVQPASAGIYTATIVNGSTTTTQSAILGVASTAKVIGTGSEVTPNVTHPNGNVYDQVLLEGSAATIAADSGQITRISYIDLSDDIVQVEFSGAGTLTLLLDSATGPAAPVNYNQSVTYMRGHASIVITGANETSNVSVFSVGRANAVNQALFKSTVTYDGVADIGYIAIQSPTGKFGGVRTANASYWSNKGLTGVYAPGVTLVGPLYVGDINAQGNATPVLQLGGVTDARITGGNLKQDNGRKVQVSGLTQLQFTAGVTSHNGALPAQSNQGALEENGADVTTQIVPGSSGGSSGGSGGKELTFGSGSAGAPYTNGAKKSFTASATTLAFDSKTLTNPTALSLSAPYSGYRFTDPATGLIWEVILNNGVIYEINLMQGSTFLGQWS